MYLRISLILLLSCTWYLDVSAQPIAFPGAEGFGKHATGGRGGKVIVVNNLNDDGPSSLREAIRKKEPRIIVFAVSGTIELSSPLNINYGDVTIAGQSAPGDGICLKNYSLVVGADNVILRFLRFRLGDEKKFEGDAISSTKGNNNIIIDHCSMSWSTDECASFYNNTNFTLQWCIVSESLNNSIHAKGAHGYGGIWGGKGASFHHNLIASHNSRMPRFSGSSTTPNGPDELVDFRNNVVYNWMNNNTYGGERGRYNVINNYYKAGPATKKSKKDQIANPWSPFGRFYMMGNCLEGNSNVSKNNSLGVKAGHLDSVFADREFKVEMIQSQTAEKSFDLVLASAGASLRRDAVDRRVTEEVRTGTASSGKNKDGIIDSQKEAGGWPKIKTLPAPADSDQDGMPDDWEKANKLNHTNASDANKKTISKEYDNIEVYLNSLVSEIVNANR